MRWKLLLIAIVAGFLGFVTTPAHSDDQVSSLIALPPIVRPARPADFPTRPGTYKLGEWEYTYELHAPGSRSERRIGRLTRNGVAVEGKDGQVIDTPVGRFKFFDRQRYTMGWLNTVTFDRPVFAEDSVNALAFDLYGKLRDGDGNLCFSPYSISSALAMTYAGARRDTAWQMAHALYYGSQEEVHPAYRDLLNRLTWDPKTPKANPRLSRLHIANALWGQQGYDFLPEFLKLTSDNYGAGFRQLDFRRDPEAARQTINRWVLDQTNGKIDEALQRGVIDTLTRLVLTNAIYLKADWASPFPSKQTYDEDFHAGVKKIRVPMMHHTAQFGYYDGGSFQALELPYKNHEMSMLVLLPKAADGLAELEKSLTGAKLAEWLPKMASERVDVALPKFKVTADFELSKLLKAMGMPDAFDFAKADFSGMDGRKYLAISAVVHKAFVNVDEQGTEAGAVTAVVVTAPVALAKSFRADRPFVYVIRDNATGSILFMGRVTQPTAHSGK